MRPTKPPQQRCSQRSRTPKRAHRQHIEREEHDQESHKHHKMRRDIAEAASAFYDVAHACGAPIQGHDMGDHLQPARHGINGYETGEEYLRDDNDGDELHHLEFGFREGRNQQPESERRQRDEDADKHDQPQSA